MSVNLRMLATAMDWGRLSVPLRPLSRKVRQRAVKAVFTLTGLKSAASTAGTRPMPEQKALPGTDCFFYRSGSERKSRPVCFHGKVREERPGGQKETSTSPEISVGGSMSRRPGVSSQFSSPLKRSGSVGAPQAFRSMIMIRS